MTLSHGSMIVGRSLKMPSAEPAACVRREGHVSDPLQEQTGGLRHQQRRTVAAAVAHQGVTDQVQNLLGAVQDDWKDLWVGEFCGAIELCRRGASTKRPSCRLRPSVPALPPAVPTCWPSSERPPLA